jgi:hypothetical protein
MSWIYGLAGFRARGAVGWNEVLVLVANQKIILFIGIIIGRLPDTSVVFGTKTPRRTAI